MPSVCGNRRGATMPTVTVYRLYMMHTMGQTVAAARRAPVRWPLVHALAGKLLGERLQLLVPHPFICTLIPYKNQTCLPLPR